MMSQMNFHMMSQDEGEPITRFVARLKSQAFLCQFNVQCSCNPGTTVSYADQMVAQRLVAGLQNVDHQRKILAEAGTLTTLDGWRAIQQTHRHFGILAQWRLREKEGIIFGISGNLCRVRPFLYSISDHSN